MRHSHRLHEARLSAGHECIVFLPEFSSAAHRACCSASRPAIRTACHGGVIDHRGNLDIWSVESSPHIGNERICNGA